MSAKGTDWAPCFGCIACGLMNSITTSWSDGPMRTTHATGPSTEVGMNFGRMMSIWLFSNSDECSQAELITTFRKFRLNVVLVFSFAVGGYAGSIFYGQFGADAMLVPTLISISVAILNLAIPGIVESSRANPSQCQGIPATAKAFPSISVNQVLTQPLLADESTIDSRFNWWANPEEGSSGEYLVNAAASDRDTAGTFTPRSERDRTVTSSDSYNSVHDAWIDAAAKKSRASCSHLRWEGAETYANIKEAKTNAMPQLIAIEAGASKPERQGTRSYHAPCNPSEFLTAERASVSNFGFDTGLNGSIRLPACDMPNMAN
eukprot:gnl/MRDRNA2_/MRDRNA2_35100_c0_seq1.p1 gnl/MRDRNA2_/MRDRNA2_35100_c0~~gnl/MRDRNA2_/MRDRNA2_35100_c0_seq1.p1  ORF type:complete len:361 (+),score=58.77 gnl/MRDRNA2_/MRDRNA2_35100_c0_seq1:128-1084(+)